MSFISKMLFLFVIALLFHCTENVAGNGSGGTETTNALVVISEGMSVRGYAPGGTRVIMCNEAFNPLHDENFIDSIVVDLSKSFMFKAVRTKGKYNIVAINSQISLGAFIPGLNVDAGSDDSILAQFDSLGNINGTILYVISSGTDTTARTNMPVYIKGTNLCTKTDSEGFFHIRNIPIGSYTIKCDQPLTATSPVEKVVSLNANHLTVSVLLVNEEGGK